MMAKWLRNCWYMAGWSDEIGEAGLTRRIIDQPVYLYRLEDGGIAALLDRCPHRFAPLSRGTREGDNLVCGYHGLTFSAQGKCVRNPYSDRIPAGTDVPAFAVAEQHGSPGFGAERRRSPIRRSSPTFRSWRRAQAAARSRATP
jgi:phenylpropionate dioxygenase-like ring-hydroxylating dioxygenase large terminal subunit